jgi:cell wall-associated NlpC family hydrolase
MPGQGKLSGLAIAEGIAGFLLFWSGLKNQTITDVIREGLSGNASALLVDNPQSAPSIGVTNNSASTSSTSTTPVPGTGAGGKPGIAADALSYVGRFGYVWGGAPDKGSSDCSGFANWVLGHDQGLAIPGYAAGKFDGSVHGPTTLSYLAWTGATTVGHSGSVAQAGDLAVWQTHMGICTGPNQMVSDQDPANGTRSSSIDGFIPGELLYIRRLT